MWKVVDFLSGAVLGALVGAGLALLMAPQSGERTRSQIQERVEMIVEEGKRAAAERRAELEAQFAEARRVPPREGF